ncbi:MAG: hypothetical protein WC655_04655 [Candidatus Hydrogenedentales bacterium]|jgi:hypothetical protein
MLFKPMAAPELTNVVFLLALGASNGFFCVAVLWLGSDSPQSAAEQSTNKTLLVRVVVRIGKTLAIAFVTGALAAVCYLGLKEDTSVATAVMVGILLSLPVALAYLVCGNRAKAWARTIVDFFVTFSP